MAVVAHFNTMFSEIDQHLYISPELVALNNELATLDVEGRLDRVMQVMRVWMSGTAEEAQNVFGEVVKLRPNRPRGMMTLTSNWGQLRVWYGFPGDIYPGHVDSCGKNLLLEVRPEAACGAFDPCDGPSEDDKKTILRYLKSLWDEAGWMEARDSIDTRIFIGFGGCPSDRRLHF